MAALVAEEWADLTPVPQDDGPDPVCAIMYRPEYVETMDIFRAVLKASEKSARALQLTAVVIDLNPANYTAWQYRRLCLEALGSDLHEELRYSEAVAYDHPKNYQIWFHRRAIVERLGDAGAEIAFVTNILLDDEKNYHAWSHRQWCLKTFGLWEGELDRMDNMLKVDVRNNSVWNERWFVISNTSGFTDEVVNREILYTFKWIETAVDNESPWNFLRGMMRVKTEVAGRTWQFARFPVFREQCVAMHATEVGRDCIPLLALLLEMYEHEANEGAATMGSARELAHRLMELDPVRRPYWQLRLKRMALEDQAAEAGEVPAACAPAVVPPAPAPGAAP